MIFIAQKPTVVNEGNPEINHPITPDSPSEHFFEIEPTSPLIALLLRHVLLHRELPLLLTKVVPTCEGGFIIYMKTAGQTLREDYPNSGDWIDEVPKG